MQYKLEETSLCGQQTQQDIRKNFLMVNVKSSGSGSAASGMPIPGIFFSLKQETVWVFRGSYRDDGLPPLELPMLPRGVPSSSCFHGLPASSQLPAHRQTEFSPRKEQLSLSVSVPHLDQPLGIHCGFSALQHLGTFLFRSQRPLLGTMQHLCVDSNRPVGPETSARLSLCPTYGSHTSSAITHTRSAPACPSQALLSPPSTSLILPPTLGPPLSCLSQWSCRMVSTSSPPHHGNKDRGGSWPDSNSRHFKRGSSTLLSWAGGIYMCQVCKEMPAFSYTIGLLIY